MRNLRTLVELQTIRSHRVEMAQKAVQVAQTNLQKAGFDKEAAKTTLDDFVLRLPSLVDELYAQCINEAVGKDAIQEIHQKELKMLTKRDDYRQEHEKACEHEKECLRLHMLAQKALKDQQIKHDALGELVKKERHILKIHTNRQDNKRLDEFSGGQYARNLS